MKVVDNTRKVRFGALSPGDCFYKSGTDRLFMVVGTSTNFTVTVSEDKFNAVSLEDGVLLCLSKASEVDPCVAEVYVKSRTAFTEVLA